jgi:predicted AlkP superfamily pyrophosphatase or phosphodiesterase
VPTIDDWDSLYSMIEDNILDDALFLHDTDSLTKAFEAKWPTLLPTMSFLYFGDIDEAGHAYGWGSSEYLAVIFTT